MVKQMMDDFEDWHLFVDAANENALFWSAEHFELAKQLVCHAPQDLITHKNAQGENVLHICAKHGYWDTMQVIFAQDLPLHEQNFQNWLNDREHKTLRTPLLMAIEV